MHSLPLSPPGDSPSAAPLSPQHDVSVLTQPPVSPSAVLPTPPPSSESSPMMSTTGITGSNHIGSDDKTEDKGGMVFPCRKHSFLSVLLFIYISYSQEQNYSYIFLQIHLT